MISWARSIRAQSRTPSIKKFRIRIQADGEDGAKAVTEIEALLKRKFDED
jgi:phosphotransferase system HPr-like phosphotransfer protein